MERSRLRNGSAGGAAGFPEGLAKAASEGGATKRQISDAGDAALPWKKMPSRTFVAREKSVPGFEASEDRLPLPAGARAAGDFKWKPVLICHSENPWVPKSPANSTLPGLCKWNNEARVAARLFTTWLTEYFQPTVDTCCSEGSFQNTAAHGQSPGHPRAPMATDTRRMSSWCLRTQPPSRSPRTTE